MAGLRPKETIAGRYEIERAVRTGGVSVVYRATDLETRAIVAVKVMNISDAEEALRRRIEREMTILTSLSHPHIVRCRDAGQLGGSRMFLVLEWLEGDDLADFTVKFPMNLRQTLAVVEQVADALAVAHDAGIIHRDIKPANIFVVTPRPDTVPDCRVLDFGVAKMPESRSALTRAGAILGTPSYMAPEQANAAMTVDGRADVFSLGVVAYELLTGSLPWTSGSDLARLAHIMIEDARPVHEVAADVPAGVADLIDTMLQRDLERRIGSAVEVRDIARGCMDALLATEMDAYYGARRVSEVVRADTLDIEPKDATPEPESTRLVPHLEVATPIEEQGPAFSSWDDTGEATISSMEASTGELERPVVPLGPSAADVGFDEALSYVDHLPRSTMFGRVSEIERLRSRALTPLTTARPSYTMVVGPAGIGKTRVRTELSRVLRESKRPPRVFAGRAEEALRNTPFAYVRKVLYALAQIRPRDDMRIRREKVQALLPSPAQIVALLEVQSGAELSQDATIPPVAAGRTTFFTGEVLQARTELDDQGLDGDTERATVAAFVCEALAIEYPEIPPVTAARNDPRLLSEQIRRALAILFRNVSMPDGLVILIDDAHFVDRQSAALFAELIDPDQEIPLAIQAFSLPHFLDLEGSSVSPLADVDRMMAEVIELLPLEPRPSREAVRRLLDSEIEADALETLVNRAKGNPLYLEQLVRAVQADGSLTRSDSGAYELSTPPTGKKKLDRVPPTVAAAVSARISTLSTIQQRVLTSAAVFGEVFWAEGVARLIDESIEDVMLHLDRLIVSELVRRRQASRYAAAIELEFTHAVIRSVALSRLKRRRRSDLEQRAAAFLEEVGERDAAVLAAHVAQGGQPVAASRMFGDAALATLQLGDPDSAAVLADMGLRVLEDVEDDDARRRLLDASEKIALVSGDWEAGRNALDQLSDIAVGDTAQADILLRRARLAYLSKRFEEAMIEADGAKEAFQSLENDAGVAGAELCRAEACEALGDGRSALRSYLFAQARLTPLSDASGLARVERGLATIAIASGDYRTAENRYRGSLVHASSQRDHDMLFRANLGLADVARLSGDTTRARDLVADARRVAFDQERQLLVRVYRARMLTEERQLEEAYDRLERIYSTAEDVRSLGSVRRLSALLRGQMLRVRPGHVVEVRPTSRRLASVEAHLERALGSAATEDPASSVALTLALGVVLALRGDDLRAKKMCAEAVERFRKEGAVIGDEPPWIFYAQARVLQLTGAPVKDTKDAMRSAIAQLDSIMSRLERKDRQRYLDRWVSRAVMDEAERNGLRLSRNASSSRLVVEE